MRVVDTVLLSQLVVHFHGRRGERQRKNIAAIGPLMPNALNSYAINTPLRQAHFLAQVCEESYALSDMREEAIGRDTRDGSSPSATPNPEMASASRAAD